jgi:hypothetical protein
LDRIEHKEQPPMKKSEFIDLSKLAQKRSRDSTMLVLQLLEDDDARVAMMIYLALDLINGATEYMAEDKKISETEAFATVFDMMVHAIGPDKVLHAIRKIISESKERRAGK